MALTTSQDIKQLGTILCVFAHPDDETFTMGGILATAAANGQEIILVTATCGELGVQDDSRWPLARLGAIREAELHDAMTILGVKNHQLLDFPDGGCADIDPAQAVGKLAALIEQHKPDSIFTFGPDGLTGHPDHRAVSAWTVAAAKQAGSTADIYFSVQTTAQYALTKDVDNALNFFFNTPEPPLCEEADAAICLTLDDNLFQKKMSALRAMPSQYQIMFEKFEEPALRGCFGTEAFVGANNA